MEARNLSELLAEALPEYVLGDQVPEATVFRLLLATLPLYHAAVLVLVDPETTLGAMALMRGLIEAWAHLNFIQTGPRETMACRALRVERGWAQQMASLARSARNADELAKADERQQQVDDLWQRSGCARASARTYKQVPTTLQAIEKVLGIDWLVATWQAASLMTHVGGFDWSLEDQADGSSAAVLPKPSHWANQLAHLIVLFSVVTSTGFTILEVNPEDGPATELDREVQRLIANRFLERAGEGDFDG